MVELCCALREGVGGRAGTKGKLKRSVLVKRVGRSRGTTHWGLRRKTEKEESREGSEEECTARGRKIGGMYGKREESWRNVR